jgi:YD repeat-containing protein
VSSYNYSGYDGTGKPLGGSVTLGAQTYSMSYSYDLAGQVKTMTYPSGRMVTNAFDNAGRLSSLAGTLGDGASRTYASGIVYDAGSRMTKEQLGTTTPIYNKLFYNARGQLSEIRESTTSATDTSWNRGAIINFYSTCWGMCGGGNSTAAMLENNGNLRRQEVYIPDNDAVTSYHQLSQDYVYDSLNRLQDVHDGTSWKQQYDYDRYGNRTINQSATFGTNIPKPNFTVSTSNNRLGVPGGQSGTMNYDTAGNLTTDTYSAAAVTRVYDAENRMTKETQANNYDGGIYKYDGDGRRVRRIVGTTETWQVYGLGGELMAEYAQNGSPATPQKEYGYRNGQLLITATAGSTWGAAPTLHDNPLVVAGTTVQSRHVTELRDAINALRSHLAMSAYSWTTSAMTNDWITAGPVLEMRTALDQALGAPSPSYATGLAQNQPVKAVHIQELRDRVLAAWSSGSSLQINWLVADQLGSPRMIFDLSGSLANTSRHDYLPFGEEILAGTADRTTTMGYTAPGYSAVDGARQKFSPQRTG